MQIEALQKLKNEGVQIKNAGDYSVKKAEERGISLRFCSTEEITKKTKKFLNFKRQFLLKIKPLTSKGN